MCQLGESNSALQKWLIDLLWILRGGVERQGNVPHSNLSKGILTNVSQVVDIQLQSEVVRGYIKLMN